MARTGAAEEPEVDEFFDSREVMSPPSVSSPAHDDGDGWLCSGALLEVWATDPCSVHERRVRFARSLGLLDPGEPQPPRSSRPRASDEEIVPGSPGAEQKDRGEQEECVDDGTVLVAHELGKDGSVRSLRERRSNRTVTAAELERISGSSPFITQLMRRADDDSEKPAAARTTRRRRRRFGWGWLRRLGIVGEANSTSSSSSVPSCSGKKVVDRVKVRPYKKRSKELSAVYRGQEIKAHRGAIVAMKFSSDGQYLATGGEDGVVRVWRVVDGERPDELDFAEDDPSCVFFTVNEKSQLAPVHNSSQGTKSKQSSKGVADPACVVIPHRTFALSRVPVHEFYGHDDAILDLSWSKNGGLLSASTSGVTRAFARLDKF